MIYRVRNSYASLRNRVINRSW